MVGACLIMVGFLFSLGQIPQVYPSLAYVTYLLIFLA
jgi:hypothetical protein|uniref:Uncharacterized protein n=1 Tax=Populus trichocarpa TaxID=3694 RepID=A0A3N7GCZ0_POPTR